MKIAVNARLLVGQEYTGVHLYVYNVLQVLLEAMPMCEFLLVTDRNGPLPPLPRKVERVTVGPPARHPFLFVAWFEWALPKAAKKWGADILLSLENLGTLRTSIPQVIVIHDLAYLKYPEGISKISLAYYRYFMPRFARKADQLVTVSKATRTHVSRSFSVKEETIAVVYNGVRPRFSRLSPKQVAKQREQLTGGHPYFIYVGAVHPRKNLEGLIKGFDSFKNDTGLPHRLVIVGSLAWKTGSVAKALEQSPYREEIQLTGYLKEEELGFAIGAARALCLVSFFEGFGVPIIEALSSGVPVLTSNISSLPEVAGPGGVLVNPSDYTSIASGLRQLATDDELVSRLIKAGAEHAKQFTWQSAGEQMAELLFKMDTKGVEA